MSTTAIYIVFAVLIAIFLCVIVPVLLYLRQMAMIRDIEAVQLIVTRCSRQFDAFESERTEIVKKIADVFAQLHAAETRDISTQETIKKLSNKFNSRVRAERKTDVVEEDDGKEEIPGTEQMNLPLVFPQQPPTKEGPASQGSHIRRFGEIP